jgi:hypothetical protein
MAQPSRRIEVPDSPQRLRTNMHPLFQKALKLLDLPLGLVINFHNPRLGDRGIARVILAGADAP